MNQQLIFPPLGQYSTPSPSLNDWALVQYLSQSRHSAHNELAPGCVCVCVCMCERERKRQGREQSERNCATVRVSKSVWVCWESVHHTRWQARAEGVAGRVAASSAVMLTDMVPGGAVTQGDGLRHDCPINSTQCCHMHPRTSTHTHTHTHTEKIRGSAYIKVQPHEMYCWSFFFFFWLAMRQ